MGSQRRSSNMTSPGLALCLLPLCLLTPADLQTNRSKKRDGRFFLISTKTAYFSTTTQCFVSGSSLTTCAARKRRILEGVEEQTDLTPVSPHLTKRTGELLDSGLLGEEDFDSQRDARFLLYWGTTTSTATSYTATSTLGSLECTPSAFTLSLCG